MSGDNGTNEAVKALRAFVIDTRAARRLTQRDVAERGGIPKALVSGVEGTTRNSIPTQRSLVGLAKGLGVPYEVLDRVIRGHDADLSQSDQAVSNLLASLPDDQRAVLLDVLLLPPRDRAMAFSALSGLLAVMRPAEH